MEVQQLMHRTKSKLGGHTQGSWPLALPAPFLDTLSPPGLSIRYSQCPRDLSHSPALCCVLVHSPAYKLLLFPWEAGPGASQSQQIPNVKSRLNRSFGWKMQHCGAGELSQHVDHLSQSKPNLQASYWVWDIVRELGTGTGSSLRLPTVSQYVNPFPCMCACSHTLWFILPWLKQLQGLPWPYFGDPIYHCPSSLPSTLLFYILVLHGYCVKTSSTGT